LPTEEKCSRNKITSQENFHETIAHEETIVHEKTFCNMKSNYQKPTTEVIAIKMESHLTAISTPHDLDTNQAQENGNAGYAASRYMRQSIWDSNE